MNEPVVYKRSVLMGQVVLMQLLIPPLVAIGMLYGLSLLYEVPFDREFRTLAVLLLILVPLLIRRPRVESVDILPRAWSVSASVILRWLLLLSVLVAIGYVTKSSTQFSRRVILTWAVVTPVPLILVGMWIFRDSLDFNILLPGLAWRIYFLLSILPHVLSLWNPR